MQTGLHKFLKRKAIDLIMWGFVRGVKTTAPTASVTGILQQFMEQYGLTHDDFNIESARVTYENMNNDYIKMLKNEKP